MDWLSVRNIPYSDIPLDRAGINPYQIYVLYTSFLKKFRPDVFIAYTAKPVVFGVIAAFCASVPIRVSMIQDSDLHSLRVEAFQDSLYGFYQQRSIGYLLSFQLIFSSRILTIATTLTQSNLFLRMFLSISSLDLELIYRGFHVSLFRLTHFVSYLSLVCLKTKVSANTLVPVASFDALVLLLSHLVGAFDSNPTSISRSEVLSWHEEGVVNWHGHLSRVQDLLGQSSVFVLPSYREGLPRTSLEALATGRPIITTDVPGCRETVINGVNGILVPPRDSSALAFVMIDLIIAEA